MAVDGCSYVVTKGGAANARKATVLGRYKTIEDARTGSLRMKAAAESRGEDPFDIRIEEAGAFVRSGGRIHWPY